MAPRLDFDMICGMEIKSLKTTFPNLYSIARINDPSMVDHLELSR
jgi:hypothetical protein